LHRRQQENIIALFFETSGRGPEFIVVEGLGTP
jgi:hypothetical protein